MRNSIVSRAALKITSLRTSTACLLTLAVAIQLSASIHAELPQTVTGQVSDALGAALRSASVAMILDERVVCGTITDEDGKFRLALCDTTGWPVQLRITCVGHHSRTVTIAEAQHCAEIDIHLQEKPAEVGCITVTGPSLRSPDHTVISADEIADRTRTSLIMTNPIAALRGSSVSKAGSMHSSQLVIHGTSPDYYLNEQTIGTDPTHYGLFSFIPSAVVRRITFHRIGTSVRFRRPAAVEFDSPIPFGEQAAATAFLSTVEANCSWQLPGQQWYFLGAVRKSVVGYLRDALNMGGGDMKLPPSNFHDIFTSAGLKFSNRTQLIVDQYLVRDHLSLNTALLSNTATGMDIYQSTRKSFLSVRLHTYFLRMVTSISLGLQTERRDYNALLEVESLPGDFYADLHEASRTVFGGLNLKLTRAGYNFVMGASSEVDLSRQSDLKQVNWNFQSPFANGGYASPYQLDLNRTFGEHSVDCAGASSAVYASVERSIGKLSLTAGLRWDRYSQLAQKEALSVRGRLLVTFSEKSQLGLSLGTYSQSPLDNILEPFQVFVRANLKDLGPIMTQVISATWTHSFFDLNLFSKRVVQLPHVEPVFDHVKSAGQDVFEKLISTQSVGKARFWGCTASIKETSFLHRRFAIWVSYTHERAYRIENGLMLHHEYEAPHRFQAQLKYNCRDNLIFAADIRIRSGLPFSPIRQIEFSSEESSAVDDGYYLATLASENTHRFEYNGYLNLMCTYTSGKLEINLAVTNATNRSNAILNSSSGVVYDLGIMPMLGLRFNL